MPLSYRKKHAVELEAKINEFMHAPLVMDMFILKSLTENKGFLQPVAWKLSYEVGISALCFARRFGRC